MIKKTSNSGKLHLVALSLSLLMAPSLTGCLGELDDGETGGTDSTNASESPLPEADGKGFHPSNSDTAGACLRAKFQTKINELRKTQGAAWVNVNWKRATKIASKFAAGQCSGLRSIAYPFYPMTKTCFAARGRMKAKNKSAQFIARNLVFQYGCSLPARNYVDGTAKRRLTPITANVPLVDVSDALQFDSQQLGTIILNKFGMRGIDAAKTNAYAVYQEQMDMHLANESMEEDVAEGFLEDFLSGVELIEDFAELADFLVDLPYAACFIVFF